VASLLQQREPNRTSCYERSLFDSIFAPQAMRRLNGISLRVMIWALIGNA